MAMEIDALKLTLNADNEIEKAVLDVHNETGSADTQELCQLLGHPYSREVTIGDDRTTVVGSCICGGQIYRPERTINRLRVTRDVHRRSLSY